jgi:acyl-CoA synthetase (NDP forming)/GNAT superfamily N-acetyltransferase
VGRADADVVLSDGSTVHIRQIGPADAGALVAMHSRLSDRTRYLRYFAPYPTIGAQDLERFVNVDHHDREALVAEHGGELLAVARYERLGPGADEAEVAFVVEDAHQGRGLGSVLMEHLAERARLAGIVRFVAEVLPANARMMRVFTDAGYAVVRRYADGVVHLTFPIATTSRLMSVQWNRERRSVARSVGRVLHPGGVAVFGARADGTGLGAAILRHLTAGGYAGRVLPVHRRMPTIGGLSAVPHLDPGDADLAVIVVPAPDVAGVVAECAAAGVASLVVVSAEADRLELKAMVRGHGMRLVGPASLGVVNPAIGLNASLVPTLPAPGRVGLYSQSAPLGIALLDGARRRGLAVSSFISGGEQADLSGNDALQYWHGDPGTDVVLLYLESFGNPRKFARVTRSLARDKPVVAVASAARSRGAPLDVGAVAALFASSGVIRVDTVAELFDTGLLVAAQPLPAGPRVGIVCDVEAFASLATGAAPSFGLAVTSQRVLPAASSGAGAAVADLAAGVRAALQDSSVDAVLVAYGPPVPSVHDVPVAAAASAVIDASRDADKPVLAVYPMGGDGADVPVYPSVEEALGALGRVAAFAAWRREPVGELPVLDDVRSDPAFTSVEDLLGCYGISVVLARRADADPAFAAAEVGFPVALKVIAEPFRHRVDLGAVRLGLADASSVAEAYADFRSRFGADVPVVVQKMVGPGVPCVVRVVDDPAFGPVVGFGLAGLATDLLGDMAWTPAPLTDRDADRLVRAPGAAPLLHGYRGAPPVDVAALTDLLLRIGRLAGDQPRLSALELNPVLVHEKGLSVLTAEMSVAQVPAARPDTGPRRLA